MPPSSANSSSSAPRRRSSRPTSARRASATAAAAAAAAGPKASSSPAPSPSFDDFPSYALTNGYFLSPTPLRIKRTVNITVEISSGTATASHMDVSQYHMPVTTSCYSPSSGDASYESSTCTSEYETATEHGAYPFSSSSSTATSSNYSYEQSAQRSSTDVSELPSEQPTSHFKYKPQHGQCSPILVTPNQLNCNTDIKPCVFEREQDTAVSSTKTSLSDIQSSAEIVTGMLNQFLAVDSRDDALVVEARVAIAEGRVNDLRGNQNLMYGWESVIDDLLQ